jgi:acyl carrier protein
MTDHSIEGVRDMLRAEIATILYVEPAQVKDSEDFAALGLDSVLGVELVDAINAEYGLAERVEAIYEHPTLADLATYVARQVSATTA